MKKVRDREREREKRHRERRETERDTEKERTSFKHTKLSVTNEDINDITNKRMLSSNANSVIQVFTILCRMQIEHVAGRHNPLPVSA